MKYVINKNKFTNNFTILNTHTLIQQGNSKLIINTSFFENAILKFITTYFMKIFIKTNASLKNISENINGLKIINIINIENHLQKIIAINKIK